MYGLPSTVCVHQPLPKNAFYQRLSLAAPVKDEFVHGIEGSCVIAAIKETACGIPAANGVEEISVLRVELKSSEVPERALSAMAQAVPRKLLMVCCHNGMAQLAVVRGRLRVGARRMAEDALNITLAGATLAEVWESLCAQALFGDAGVADVDARLAREKLIAELEAEVVGLKRKWAKEVQPSKRNAAHKAYKQAKAELAVLKGE